MLNFSPSWYPAGSKIFSANSVIRSNNVNINRVGKLDPISSTSAMSKFAKSLCFRFCAKKNGMKSDDSCDCEGQYTRLHVFIWHSSVCSKSFIEASARIKCFMHRLSSVCIRVSCRINVRNDFRSVRSHLDSGSAAQQWPAWCVQVVWIGGAVGGAITAAILAQQILLDGLRVSCLRGRS